MDAGNSIYIHGHLLLPGRLSLFAQAGGQSSTCVSRSSAKQGSSPPPGCLGTSLFTISFHGFNLRERLSLSVRRVAAGGDHICSSFIDIVVFYAFLYGQLSQASRRPEPATHISQFRGPLKALLHRFTRFLEWSRRLLRPPWHIAMGALLVLSSLFLEVTDPWEPEMGFRVLLGKET